FFGSLDRHHVLIVLRADFQFDNITVIVAVALQFFGFGGVVFVGVYVDPSPAGRRAAFEHLAVFLQLVPIVSNQFARGIVGVVAGNQQLHAEGLGQNCEVRAAFVFLGMLRSRARIKRQPDLAGVSIVAHMKIAHRTANILVFVLVGIAGLLGSRAKGQAQNHDELSSLSGILQNRLTLFGQSRH